MRMKRILLATSALAVLAGAQQAQAASDMYVSVFGGANFQPDQSQSFYSSSFTLDPDTGFVLGGTVGTRLTNWAKGLRAEVEFGYRRNDVAGAWTSSYGTTGGYIDANMSTFAIMANAWYDIDIGSKVRPYVGGGVGWARTRLEIAQIETFSTSGPGFQLREDSEHENSGFAWQLGLGINYEVAPDVDVGIGYRYFVGPNISDGGEGFLDFDEGGNIDNENHAVQLHLTIGIN
ncbi:MAG: outer membrane protein [Micropepsaceae bacterium]